MKNRDNGYYWCFSKKLNQWRIYYWESLFGQFVKDCNLHLELDFLEIIEDRIPERTAHILLKTDLQMRNETLIKLAQDLLFSLVTKCEIEQQNHFKRIYSKNSNISLMQVIEQMDPTNLDHAITQAENTLDK